MANTITTIAFDADDTLWHNERYFYLTQDRFVALLADYMDGPDLKALLVAAERRNILHYGFGVKGFVLSMIETALEVTENKVPGKVLAELIEAGKDMLAYPIELLPFAAEAVDAAKSYGKVIVITKGDLLDQERKIAQSGMGEVFDGVEIVSEKVPDVYARIFAKHGTGPAQGMMIGNTMKSDVVAMIDAGGWGVFVPHGQEWEIERADPPSQSTRFHTIPDLGALPALLDQITKG
jgi:putative hydrolase of the HAD superfamily